MYVCMYVCMYVGGVCTIRAPFQRNSFAFPDPAPLICGRPGDHCDLVHVYGPVQVVYRCHVPTYNTYFVDLLCMCMGVCMSVCTVLNIHTVHTQTAEIAIL